MNRFGAAVLKVKGPQAVERWLYVGKNAEFTWLVGYCAEQKCAGHPTRAACIEHFRDWLLDRSTNYDGEYFRPVECEICAKPTSMFAYNSYMGWDFYLCEQHLNREGVIVVIGPSLDSFYR